jgi:alpha-ketoglutarate-dependent 2,4-dichlorophenoxyacetate dioxygenase
VEKDMAVTIQPITPSFAAEVGDIDLGAPISRDDIAAIKAAFTKYAVLVFPDQGFSDESHLDFARHFGPLETSVFKLRSDHKMRLDEKMADVGNLDADNNILETNDRIRLYQLGNRLWHTDSSFKRLPAYCSILHGRSIPPVGGHTEFADLRAAYDALADATRRRIAGLVAEHSLMTSRAKLGFTDFDEAEREAFRPVPQVIVRRLQDSGRMSLYLASHAGSIIGMNDTEAKKLLAELIEHATQRQFVYTHRWRVNDLVMWDDRCTMHRGLEFDDQRYKRDMRRATVSDVAPTCEQMGLAVAAE